MTEFSRKPFLAETIRCAPVVEGRPPFSVNLTGTLLHNEGRPSASKSVLLATKLPRTCNDGTQHIQELNFAKLHRTSIYVMRLFKFQQQAHRAVTFPLLFSDILIPSLFRMLASALGSTSNSISVDRKRKFFAHRNQQDNFDATQ